MQIEILKSDISVNIDAVRLSNHDYIQTDLCVEFDKIIDKAVADMRQKFIDNNINTSIIFAANASNARHILKAWEDNSTMRMIYCSMPIEERRDALNWFKNGSGKRYIIDLHAYIEGYDFRSIECVVLLRATALHWLFMQMLGSVMRQHEDSVRRFLIDYGTNLSRLTK